MRIEQAAEQRAPREMHGDLVRESAKRRGQPLSTLDDERDVRKPCAPRLPRATDETVRTGVDGDREGVGMDARVMDDVGAIARANVDDDAAERGGESSGLTDVYVDEALAEKTTHERMLAASDERDQPGEEERGTEEHQDRAAEARSHRIGPRESATPGEHDRGDTEQRADGDDRHEE